MKLTSAQQRVVDLMRDGWELGVSTSSSRGGAWLQKNGVGRGGDTESVNGNTFQALVVRGVIEQAEYGFPSSRWGLTEQWKGTNGDK